MVRIAAAAVLAFAVSALALSSDGTNAHAAVLRTRQDAEAPAADKPNEEAPAADKPNEDTPEDFKKWLLTVAEAAEELRKMLEGVANKDAGKTN